MSAVFLGMPMALFPAINAERFGGHPVTLGLLTTAVAVGSPDQAEAATLCLLRESILNNPAIYRS